MATAIDIVNLAISDCGCALITTFDDLTPEARVAKAKYSFVKDAVLESREWSFAKQRILLNKDPAVPAFGYAFQFILPSTILRVIRIYDATGAAYNSPLVGWVREGYRILTNTDAPIYAEVLVRVDEGSFSPGMVLALAARLVSVMAIPLTENRQLAKDNLDFYGELMKDAGAMDGSQGTTQVIRPPALRGRQPSGI